MCFKSFLPRCAVRLLWSGAVFVATPLLAQSNLPVRIMAANITSGNLQSYEAAGIRIFQGLKPDIVAIQEFQYGGSTASNDLRTLVNTAFGSEFSFYCEPNNGIPNGIVSRWQIVSNGWWEDPFVSDREFAWAQIDLPGTNDLYVVSVHLYGSGSASDRGVEANIVKAHILTNFPANAWVVVGGDFNAGSRSEACVNNFKTILSDSPIPTDRESGGNDNTNENRNKPYDYLLASFSFTNQQVDVVVGPNTFPKGLVFDTTDYANTYTLSAVVPVQSGDSHVSGMQHMAVIKDFLITTNGTAITNPPAITSQPQSQTNSVGANVTFTVTATGTEPLAYQWRFNTTNIVGATTNSYTINDLQATNAGEYSVVVTNLAGSVTSSNATLTVISAPSISTQPQSQTAAVGQNVTFFVIATGDAPLDYQWRFSGTNIAGATATNLVINSVQTTNAGGYTVVITNTSGSLTSSVATLTVNEVSATNVVISQIYGGGGNTGASYRNDFVELFNPTPSAVNVSTWSVQYASSSGTSWQVANLVGTIEPYHYYLVQLASSAAIGSLLPAADATGGANISASQGKVALANSQTALSGSNPVGTATVVDFVGYGSANAFEGTAAAGGAPTGNNTTSILRKNGGYTETNNNTNDFTTLSPPTPRNTNSPANPPSSPPAAAPVFSQWGFAAGQFQTLLTGTAGSNYIVQASTNLATTNWVSLRTNASPFTFADTNASAFPGRYYRGVVAP